MSENDFADGRITVRKSELLSTIKANRDQHQKDYDEAYDGFRYQLDEQLTSHLARLKAGDIPPLTINLTVPVNHVKDYDRVIRMLEMSTAEEATISETQFTQYVMDEWHWKGQFASTVQQYSSR